MAGIDSLLGIVSTHGADELRLATDEAPSMYARGAPKRLAIPVTSAEMLRHLLGPLLSTREAALQAQKRVEFAYAPEGDKGGGFRVTLRVRGADGSGKAPGIEAIFMRGSAPPVVSLPIPPHVSLPVPPGAPPPSPSKASLPPAVPSSVASFMVPPVAAEIAPPRGVAPVSVDESQGVRRAAVAIDRAVDGAIDSLGHDPRPDGDAGAGVTAGPALSSLLSRARALRASDVHLLEGAPPSLRIDGALRPMGEDEDGPEAVTAMLRELRDRHIAGARAVLVDGRAVDCVVEIEGGRFRVHLFRAAEGLAAAIRVLPRTAPTLAELHLPVALDDLVLLPHGLVIVCGPTGSGKSATLAALAQHAVRKRSALLISLEDPIEYVIQPGAPMGTGLVRQRQIGRDARDFGSGLRDALREDPDLILVGEMRDSESVSLALTAAETGHLVLTSLHSRSAPSAIERIVDACAASRHEQVRGQLADSLRAVVAQRLLPKARGGGRVPALEVMRGNHNVASLIRDGKTAQLATAIQSSRKEGMLSLEACLAELVRAGQVQREEAVRVANNPADLAAYLQGPGHG